MRLVITLIFVNLALVVYYFAFRVPPPRSKLGSVAHQLEGPFRRRR